MRAAAQWDQDNRPDAHLLRSGAIADVEAWAGQRPRNAPELGVLVSDFLSASRNHEMAARDQRRRLVGRAFVLPVQQAAAAGLHDRALRLAAAGLVLAEDFDFSMVPELWLAVAASVFDRRIVASFRGDAATVSCDGALVAAAQKDGSVQLWNVVSGGHVRLRADGVGADSIAFSPDGTVVVTASRDGAVRAWDAKTGSPIATMDHPVVMGLVSIRTVSPDGGRVTTDAQVAS